MVIQVNGKTTKNKEKVATFIQMDRNMMDNGNVIKSQELEHTSTKMEIFISEDGKKTEDQVTER